jgi:phage/plasmid-associated DNA primase
MGSGFKHLPEGAKKTVTDYDSLSLFMSKYLSVIYVKDRKSFYEWKNETQLYTEKTEAELTNTACKLIKPRVIDPNSVIQRIAGAIEVNASRVEQKMLAQDGTIPLKNGLFSIQNGTLDPYTPKILTTNKLPYGYDPSSNP